MGGKSSSQSNPVTTNQDKRVAVSDGVGVSGDSNSINVQRADAAVLSATASMQGDAVKAMSNAGADMVRASQAAIVDLAETSSAANVQAWDTTVTQGAKLIDSLIDKVGEGFGVANKAIDSFQPEQNKTSDSMKWGMIAAAGVAAAVLLGAGAKK